MFEFICICGSDIWSEVGGHNYYKTTRTTGSSTMLKVTENFFKYDSFERSRKTVWDGYIHLRIRNNKP
jgi:hypothetical protein